jgi:hypothetical protein
MIRTQSSMGDLSEFFGENYIEIIQHKVETYGAMFLHDYSATDLSGFNVY